MITIIGQKFHFNGIDSETYSVSIVNFENTEWKYTSGSGREHIKDKTSRSSEYSILATDENQVLTFQLEIVCEKDYTVEDEHILKNWLFKQKDYKKLVIDTESMSNYIFNCVLKANQDYIINGKFTGMSFDVECSSPYAWQDISKHIVPTTNPFEYTINNDSGAIHDVNPIVEFVLKGSNQNFTIKNTSDENNEFKWTALNQGEKIICDCESGVIQSYLWATLPEPAHWTENPTNRLAKLNKSFLKLVDGDNVLSISGTDGVTDIVEYVDIKYRRAVRLGGGII